MSPTSSRTLFISALLLPALAACGAAAAATFHVRTDGGNASQCTGRADAPYPGTGTARPCAWRHPYDALPPGGSPRITGGDTLYIGPGDYMIGWGAPGSNVGRCTSSTRYDCHLAAVPSGPSALQRTRIIGKGSRRLQCDPPTLWGTERVSTVINLQGSSNVEVGCLEITDRSDCVEYHANAGARCNRSSTPYGAWAWAGLTASNSSNVWLHDLDIHGLAHTGIRAGGLADWQVDRTRIHGNGWVGWDGDIGGGSSNSGLIALRRVEIAWNGCGQRWQGGAYWACWAQQGGGYGDGLGTATTGGQWLVEDSSFHHNTSDGLDLLYLDGAATSSITVRRVHAWANAGQQIKTRGNALIENSVIVGHCSFFDGRDAMLPGDNCRALGSSISLTLGGNHVANLFHNTITGEGDCLVVGSGGSAGSRVDFRNNAFIGQDEYGTSELSCGYYADGSSAVVTFSGNLFWNVKNNQCPAGSTCGQQPRLADASIDGFDPQPLPGSPLVNRAPDIGLVNDFRGLPRPVGPLPDIGAIEVRASSRLR